MNFDESIPHFDRRVLSFFVPFPRVIVVSFVLNSDLVDSLPPVAGFLNPDRIYIGAQTVKVATRANEEPRTRRRWRFQGMFLNSFGSGISFHFSLVVDLLWPRNRHYSAKTAR